MDVAWKMSPDRNWQQCSVSLRSSSNQRDSVPGTAKRMLGKQSYSNFMVRFKLIINSKFIWLVHLTRSFDSLIWLARLYPELFTSQIRFSSFWYMAHVCLSMRSASRVQLPTVTGPTRRVSESFSLRVSLFFMCASGHTMRVSVVLI